MSTALLRIVRRMASLPLFSPSFMPKDGASFAPSRPAAPASSSNRTGSPAGRRRDGGVAGDRSVLPAMRSLFDPMPPALPPLPSSSLQSSLPPLPKSPLSEVPAAFAHRSTAGPSVSVGSRVPSGPSSTVEPIAGQPTETRTRPVLRAANVERTAAALRETGLAGRFWRGDALAASTLPSRPSGFRALDEQLPGGGWPARCMTELLLAQPGIGEIRFLASTLAALTQEGREIVLLSPPFIPDPTGWEQLGIDMRRVLIVRTPKPVDRLWALEQSLKSSAFGALVAWLPEERALARHDALRRLQLAAATADGLTFVMRPLQAQHHASPAPLRLALSVGKPDGYRHTLSVQLLKRRGPVLTRPLTLSLPEIHRGLKAFSPALTPAARADASTKPLAAAPHPAKPSPTASHPPASKSIVAHALAGSVLSDARA